MSLIVDQVDASSTLVRTAKLVSSKVPTVTSAVIPGEGFSKELVAADGEGAGNQVIYLLPNDC